jgi:sodium-dependent dicarboxylate transporter 2/3/5
VERGPHLGRRIGFAAGLAALLGLAFIPSGLHRIEGFGDRPAFAAGVAAMMAIWWFAEAVPIAVTACAPLLLFPLFGVFGRGIVGDAARSAEPFMDAYIFLFMGGMTIGAAMDQWHLHRRVALLIMRAIGEDPKRLLLGVLVATASSSLWISNTATAVMMMPIGLALLAQLEAGAGGKRLNHYGTAIMLAVAYASNVGGIGTKIGTGTNSIFCGFVSEKLGREIGFLQYITLGAPFVVIFIPIVWLVLWRTGKKDAPTSGLASGGSGGRTAPRALLDHELAAMGAMSRGEKKVAAVFVAAAVLWIVGDPLRKAIAPLFAAAWDGWKLQGKHYEAAVAMAAAFTLIGLRAVSFASLRRVPWGTLVLLGGSFAMASGIEGSGLSKWMAGQLSGLAGLPLLAQVGLASLGTVFLSAVASNTATVNVALNVLPPSMSVLSATAIAASCDFMLPAGTPPNAIVFGSGYIRLPTMMKVGFVLDVTAVVIVTFYAYVVAPLVFR